MFIFNVHIYNVAPYAHSTNGRFNFRTRTKQLKNTNKNWKETKSYTKSCFLLFRIIRNFWISEISFPNVYTFTDKTRVWCVMFSCFFFFSFSIFVRTFYFVFHVRGAHAYLCAMEMVKTSMLTIWAKMSITFVGTKSTRALILIRNGEMEKNWSTLFPIYSICLCIARRMCTCALRL